MSKKPAVLAAIMGRALALGMAALLSPLFASLPAYAAQAPAGGAYDNPLVAPQPYAPLEAPGMERYLNILLLGFDADYKSYAQDGGDSHADAMMVVSVDTAENAVRLITLPRDTLTYVPGIRGIYKLNGAVNAGGGKTREGLEKAVEAASWLLGNVPIQYYFGIDMDRIPVIGDLLGGVEVDVTVRFTTQQGKSYSIGRRHLDGQAMYSYMRARKEAEGTDKRRTERQRAVISALLQKIGQEQLYLRIPQILTAIQEGCHTNVSPAVIFQLLPVGMGMEMVDIPMSTMAGSLRPALNGWNIHFIDQEARVQMLRELFGIEAAPLRYGSSAYCRWLVGNGQGGDGALSALRYLYVAGQVQAYGAEQEDPAGEVAAKSREVAELAEQLKKAFCRAADRVDRLGGDYKKDSQALERIRQMDGVKEGLRTATTELAALAGFEGLGEGGMHWAYRTRWETDPAINEVYVNFH